MRSIAFVNQSSLVPGPQFLIAAGALQTQVNRDFAPEYGVSCQLHCVNADPKVPYATNREAIILLDHSDQAGALGYHLEQGGVPRGFVFVQDSLDDVGNWESCASHELLEQLVDPWCDYCATVVLSKAFGHDADKPAVVALEDADPVENDSYAIPVKGKDGKIHQVPVSNFVLPAWFSGEIGPYDFLKRLTAPLTLTSGGYVSYSLDGGRTWKDVTARKKTRYSRFHKRRLRAAKRI